MNQVKTKRSEQEFSAKKFLKFLDTSNAESVNNAPSIDVNKLSRSERKVVVNAVLPKILAVTKNSGIWALCALDEVRKVSELHAGKEMLTEQIRLVVEPKIGPAPNDGRAWGGVIRKAAQLGYLSSDGRWSPAKTSHGGPKVLWTLAGDKTGSFMTDSQKEQSRRFMKVNARRAAEI